MCNKYFFKAILFCVAIFLSGFAVVAAPPHPNIILIMADDVGYGDIGFYGAKGVETPHLDNLAREGLRFTNGYCNAATCTPTRFALMTGMHAFRQRGTGIAPPNATAIIQPGTPTMASMFQQAGYTTGIIGKWHLGLGTPPIPDWNGELKPGPLEIGFDSCFIFPTTNDRVPSVYIENHRVRNLDPNDPLDVPFEPRPGEPTGVTHRDTLKLDWSHGHNQTIHNGIGRIGWAYGGKSAMWRDEDMATDLTEQAVNFIKTNASKKTPFFLMFTPHNIHVPRMPHERFQGKSELGLRGDALLELDWSIGELMKAVSNQNIREKTLVVFCSDNGPVLDDGYKDGAVEKLGDHKPASVFRGGKGTPYEGGTRIPFFVSWPGTIVPGESKEIICTIDFPATFAAFLGQKVPDGAFPDSFALKDTLLSGAGAKKRPFMLNEAQNRFGYRKGDWKLVTAASPPNKSTGLPQIDMNRCELFHLADDIGETNNLAATYPERLKELYQEITTLMNRKNP